MLSNKIFNIKSDLNKKITKFILFLYYSFIWIELRESVSCDLELGAFLLSSHLIRDSKRSSAQNLKPKLEDKFNLKIFLFA